MVGHAEGEKSKKQMAIQTKWVPNPDELRGKHLLLLEAALEKAATPGQQVHTTNRSWAFISSSASCGLARLELNENIPIEENVNPAFTYNLKGVWEYCDLVCTMQSTKVDVTVFGQNGMLLVR